MPEPITPPTLAEREARIRKCLAIYLKPGRGDPWRFPVFTQADMEVMVILLDTTRLELATRDTLRRARLRHDDESDA